MAHLGHNVLVSLLVLIRGEVRRKVYGTLQDAHFEYHNATIPHLHHPSQVKLAHIHEKGRGFGCDGLKAG